MNILLKYSPNNDNRFFESMQYKLGDYNFQISATTLSGKNDVNLPLKPNEDAFSIKILNNTLIAVLFDGTTSLKPIASLKDQTGARFASHFLKSAFESEIKEHTPKKIIRELNQLLLKRSLQFDGASLSDTHTLPASTMTIVQIDPQSETINLSHVGDSFCVVYYKNGDSKFMTVDVNRNYDSQILGLIGQIAKEKHSTPRAAREDEKVKQALLDMFQDSHNKADGTGQGLINGDPNAKQYIQDLSFALDSIEALFLGSDGIIPPGYDEQKEEDRKKIFKILKNKGLKELIRIKCETEDNDPDWNLVRYKHSDDATGIFIEVI